MPSRAVIWGLGSFRQPRAAHIRCQLALLVLLQRRLMPQLALPMVAVDPAFTPGDVQLLHSLGIEVETDNSCVAEVPTLFFLPHCGAALTELLLAANAAAGTLHNVLLLGNGLTAIREAWQRRGSAMPAPAIVLGMLHAGSPLREYCLPENGFPVTSSFNDLSLHTFYDDQGAEEAAQHLSL